VPLVGRFLFLLRDLPQRPVERVWIVCADPLNVFNESPELFGVIGFGDWARRV
jgi:hypothetical protein